MEREAWCSAVHGIAMSWTWLRDWTDSLTKCPTLGDYLGKQGKMFSTKNYVLIIINHIENFWYINNISIIMIWESWLFIYVIYYYFSVLINLWLLCDYDYLNFLKYIYIYNRLSSKIYNRILIMNLCELWSLKWLFPILLSFLLSLKKYYIHVCFKWIMFQVIMLTY